MSRQAAVRQAPYDKLFIDGAWVAPASERIIDVISPATEEIIARVPEGVEADIDAAVGAARRAFDSGPWGRSDLAERMAVLSKLSAQFADRAEEIAQLVGRDDRIHARR
ncbi:aldehyde dehydrogenase family protein [Nocardia kruczakiae]|uniref:aldehyde dehydrogenase family protein n=1 Tax=Nocardia kruczakiae TaxID=261477 RepID=UPI000A96C329